MPLGTFQKLFPNAIDKQISISKDRQLVLKCTINPTMCNWEHTESKSNINIKLNDEDICPGMV